MLKSIENLKVIASYLEEARGKSLEALKKMSQKEQFDYVCENPTSKSVQKITGLSEDEVIKEFGKRAPKDSPLGELYAEKNNKGKESHRGMSEKTFGNKTDKEKEEYLKNHPKGNYAKLDNKKKDEDDDDFDFNSIKMDRNELDRLFEEQLPEFSKNLKTGKNKKQMMSRLRHVNLEAMNLNEKVLNDMTAEQRYKYFTSHPNSGYVKRALRSIIQNEYANKKIMDWSNTQKEKQSKK